MKLQGNKILYYLALVAYATLLWFVCVMSAVLVGLDSGSRTMLYAFFIAFIMLFMWSKKYIAKWFGIEELNKKDGDGEPKKED